MLRLTHREFLERGDMVVFKAPCCQYCFSEPSKDKYRENTCSFCGAVLPNIAPFGVDDDGSLKQIVLV